MKLYGNKWQISVLVAPRTACQKAEQSTCLEPKDCSHQPLRLLRGACCCKLDTLWMFYKRCYQSARRSPQNVEHWIRDSNADPLESMISITSAEYCLPIEILARLCLAPNHNCSSLLLSATFVTEPRDHPMRQRFFRGRSYRCSRVRTHLTKMVTADWQRRLARKASLYLSPPFSAGTIYGSGRQLWLRWSVVSRQLSSVSPLLSWEPQLVREKTSNVLTRRRWPYACENFVTRFSTSQNQEMQKQKLHGKDYLSQKQLRYEGLRDMTSLQQASFAKLLRDCRTVPGAKKCSDYPAPGLGDYKNEEIQRIRKTVTNLSTNTINWKKVRRGVKLTKARKLKDHTRRIRNEKLKDDQEKTQRQEDEMKASDENKMIAAGQNVQNHVEFKNCSSNISVLQELKFTEIVL